LEERWLDNKTHEGLLEVPRPYVGHFEGLLTCIGGQGNFTRSATGEIRLCTFIWTLWVGRDTIRKAHVFDSLKLDKSPPMRLSTGIGETSLPPFPLAHPSKTIGGATFILLFAEALFLPTGLACKCALSASALRVKRIFRMACDIHVWCMRDPWRACMEML